MQNPSFLTPSAITVVLSPKPICILYILFLIYLFNAHLLHKNANSVRSGFPLHLSFIHYYIPTVSNLIFCVRSHSITSDSVNPWTVAHQVPLSMGFSRQEHWSGLPFPSPGDLPDPGIDCVSCVFCIGRWILYTIPPGKPSSLIGPQ
ncbi:unnamed protein product [Rangifer tarandus platyrhynchus]|uniref:Uncharacterized protein n=1 Tax=Rangifer tarandus platyrhynchus TaxID=3082113 RepID=A0AC60A5V1_RANTA